MQPVSLFFLIDFSEKGREREKEEGEGDKKGEGEKEREGDIDQLLPIHTYNLMGNLLVHWDNAQSTEPY